MEFNIRADELLKRIGIYNEMIKDQEEKLKEKGEELIEIMKEIQFLVILYERLIEINEIIENS
jgi:hypothetical protein